MKTLLLLAAIGLTISCEAPPRTTKRTNVEQEYPNPFSPSPPKIEYRVTGPDSSKVVVVMYRVTGELVDTLINAYRLSGEYELQIPGPVYASLASGIYFYSVTLNDSSYTKKLVLMK